MGSLAVVNQRDNIITTCDTFSEGEKGLVLKDDGNHQIGFVRYKDLGKVIPIEEHHSYEDGDE